MDNGYFHKEMLAYVSNKIRRENQNACFMRSELFFGKSAVYEIIKKGERTHQNYWAVNAFRNLIDI
jgi:hypothetical protein